MSKINKVNSILSSFPYSLSSKERDNIIFLTGEVNTYEEKFLIGEKIAKLKAYEHVVNDITVKGLVIPETRYNKNVDNKELDNAKRMSIHRSAPNNNFIYNQAVYQIATYGTETYWKYYATNISNIDFGLETTYFITPGFIVNGQIIYDYIHNWKVERGNDIRNNFHLVFGIQYNF